MALGVPAAFVQTRVDKQRWSWVNIFARMDLRRTIPGESDHVRDEVVRQRIEDYDADAGVGDMLNDYHEAHFDEGRRE